MDQEKRQLHLNIEYILAIVLQLLNLYFADYLKYTPELKETISHCIIVFGSFLVLFNTPYIKKFNSSLYVVSHILQIIVWSYLPINANYDPVSVFVYIGAIIAVASGFLQINSRGVYFYPLCVFVSLFFFRNFEVIMTSSIFCLCTVVILGFRYFLRKQKEVLSSDAVKKNTLTQSRDYFFHTLLNPLNIFNGKLQLASMDKISPVDSKKMLKENLDRIKYEIDNFSVENQEFKDHKMETDHFRYKEYRNLKRILSGVLCFILLLSLFFFKGFSGRPLFENFSDFLIISTPLIIYALALHLEGRFAKAVAPIFIFIYLFVFFILGDNISSGVVSMVYKFGVSLVCIHISSFHKGFWFYLAIVACSFLYFFSWGLPHSVIAVSFLFYISLMCRLEMSHEESFIELTKGEKEKSTPHVFVEELKEFLMPKINEMETVVDSMNEENASASILELKSMARSLAGIIKDKS